MQLKNLVTNLRYYLEPMVLVIKTSLPQPVKTRIKKVAKKSAAKDLIYRVESRSRLIFWWRLRQTKTYTGNEVLKRFNKRRNRQRLMNSGMQMGLAIALVAVLMVYIVYPSFPKAILTSVETGWVTMMAQFGVKVKTIEISGNQQLSTDQVLFLSHLQADQPLLGIDGEAIRRRLLAEPWVEQAVVERHMPNRVTIKITEWSPVALWRESSGQNSTEPYAYIDSNGRILAQEFSPSAQKIAKANYIRVTGVDANRAADSLRMMVKVEPGLAGRITRAEWVGGRRWNVIIDNRLLVKLPEQRAANSWSKLAELDAKYRLCDRRIAVIDFRQQDRIIVTPGGSWVMANGGVEARSLEANGMRRVG
ncbi:MAG: FtsQ-type POTRA domain-containing protein [Candidatus Pacebacteria bacterium]|nr:FtsQ-type POTRA domain-containing protein [Candidatus Paceibacterota bacterium]